jgi:hypothetical protein
MNMDIRRLLCAFSAMALVLAGGCESEKEDEAEISISPVSCKIKVHESKVFTATGGEKYHWIVQNPSLGTLSSEAGATVIYTASSQTGDQVITVTGVNVYGEEKAAANASIQQWDPEAGKSESTSNQSTDTATESTSESATESN